MAKSSTQRIDNWKLRMSGEAVSPASARVVADKTIQNNYAIQVEAIVALAAHRNPLQQSARESPG